MILSANIRQARISAGMSQRELADAAGISRSYMNDIEKRKGTGDGIPFSTLRRIADGLNVDVTDLMNGVGTCAHIQIRWGAEIGRDVVCVRCGHTWKVPV